MVLLAWFCPLPAVEPAHPPADKAPVQEAADQATPKKDRAGEPDDRFLKRHQAFLAARDPAGHDLVLVGDYLTDDFRGHARNGVGAIFARAFSAHRPLNLGQGGDHTQHVLWRLQNGELDGYTPKVMMLMIGGTNGSNNEPAERILAGVKAIIATAQAKVPGLKVLLLSVLPWDAKPGSRRQRHIAVNALLPTLDDGGRSVLYVDLAPLYLDAEGNIPADLMPDGVHLSDKGYALWADAMAVPLRRLFGENE
jgi:lysophospholipase L1-like esterase